MSKLRYLTIPKVKNSKIITTNNVVLGNFGNLNQNKTHSGTGDDIAGTDNYLKMINFNTNNSNKLRISSIMFALRNIGTNLVRAGIFNDLNGSPDSPLIISEPILFQSNNSAPSIYKFDFKNYLLSPNSNYWVGMIDKSRWYYKNSDIITEYNNSGYSVGLVKRAVGLSGSWETIDNQNFQLSTSLSIEAIDGPKESIVFGNLGNNNDFYQAWSSNYNIVNPNRRMIGFNTGNSSKLNLSSVICVLSPNQLLDNIRCVIMSDNNGSPGQVLARSNSINIYNIGAKKYRFVFNNILLSSNTNYWIGIDAERILWFLNTTLFSPTLQEYNNSGYSYISVKTSNNNLSGPWTTDSSNIIPANLITLNMSCY